MRGAVGMALFLGGQAADVSFRCFFCLECFCFDATVTEWDWGCGSAPGCPSTEADSRFPAAAFFSCNQQPNVLSPHTQNSDYSFLSLAVNS